MRELLKSKNFRTLLIACALVLALMLYSAGTTGQQNIISVVTSFVTYPIQKLSAIISGGMGELGDDFTDIDTIRAENELLKAKVRELLAQQVDYYDLQQENERLKELLDIKAQNEDYEFVAATVISRDSTDTYGTFIIDKGTLNGVSYLDPVITEDGLVGYISEAGPISSKVTTILSPATDVGAIDKRTLDGGMLSGDLELAKSGYAKLSYLQRDCDVTSGDIIVTSGLGGVYPKNLIIGEVIEIKAEAQDISLYAIIDPLADIESCTDVFVLTHFAGQGAVVDGELADMMVVSSGDVTR